MRPLFRWTFLGEWNGMNSHISSQASSICMQGWIAIHHDVGTLHVNTFIYIQYLFRDGPDVSEAFPEHNEDPAGTTAEGRGRTVKGCVPYSQHNDVAMEPRQTAGARTYTCRGDQSAGCPSDTHTHTHTLTHTHSPGLLAMDITGRKSLEV